MRRTLLHHGQPSRRRMPLSPLDAYEDHFPVGYVAFYRSTLHPAHVQRSLTEVLAHYPPLTGRVVRDARGHKAFALEDAGLAFEVDAILDSRDDWRAPDRERIGRFVRLPHPQVPLRSTRPLATVRLTQLRGGGSVLGIGLGHVLADGTAIARFLGDWARVARGERIEPPMWDRDEQARALATAGLDEARVPLDARSHLGLHEATLPELARLYAHLLRHYTDFVAHTIRLRGEDLEDLKARASTGHDAPMSSNDLLCAYLWKLFARGLPPEHRTRFFGVTDLRKHTPGVPARGLFGNFSGHSTIEARSGDVAREDLRTVARRLRDDTRAIGPARFAEQQAWLRHRAERRRMHRVLAAEPYAGDVAISNCRFIPFYDLDLGEGRPYFFNLPAERFPRTVIWPAPDGDGCVLNLHLRRAQAPRVLAALGGPRPLSLAALEHHDR